MQFKNKKNLGLILMTLLILVLGFGTNNLNASADEFYSRGIAKMENSDFKGALRDFERALRYRQNYEFAYNKKGEALFNLGKIFEAIENFKRAVAINPRYAEALYNLGFAWENIHLEQKVRRDPKTWKRMARTQFSEALKAYKRAIEITPLADTRAVAKAHFRSAVLLREKELSRLLNNETPNLKIAITHAEKSVELWDDFPEAHNELGILYDLIGRYPEAIDHFRQAINLHKLYAEAWSNRGVAHWHDGNWDLALSDSRHAVELDPKLARARYNLGQVLFAQVKVLESGEHRALRHHEVKKAIDEFRLAAQLDTEQIEYRLATGQRTVFIEARFALAQALHAYHDYQGAAKVYEEIMELDRKNRKKARALLKELLKEEKAYREHIPRQYR
jgi:tetratricopeptide (TPR) repeat protein